MMKSTVFSAVLAVALSVAVVLMFATAPASADSMQQKDNPEASVDKSAMDTGTKAEKQGETSKHMKSEMKGKSESSAEQKAVMPSTGERGASAKPAKTFERGASVGVVTEPHQDVFFGGEAGATAERDRRFLTKPRHVTGERSDTMAGVVVEPHQDVFFGGEAGATAERDRRFSDASRFLLRFAGPGEIGTPVPQPGTFYNGEHGATAERDRRAANVARAEQRGLMRVESVPELIVSGEPTVEWYGPFAESAGTTGWGTAAGAGSSWAQAARAGSMVSRRQRAVAPVYIYEVDPYPYDYWFAPISGQQ